jgi:hypothetical protein
MVLANGNVATTRSGSAGNKPDEMVCNTFGSTHAASISQTAPNSRRLSTVYLADVSKSAFDTDGELSQLYWESYFQKSRWFARGWTLQDLIAPALVEFFSGEGEHLGDKRSLERHIVEATGIPVEALRGSPLSNFSISERMSWVEDRGTKDKVYSLLGIFDVYMSLIYGEGK